MAMYQFFEMAGVVSGLSGGTILTGRMLMDNFRNPYTHDTLIEVLKLVFIPWYFMAGGACGFAIGFTMETIFPFQFLRNSLVRAIIGSIGTLIVKKIVCK